MICWKIRSKGVKYLGIKSVVNFAGDLVIFSYQKSSYPQLWRCPANLLFFTIPADHIWRFYWQHGTETHTQTDQQLGTINGLFLTARYHWQLGIVHYQRILNLGIITLAYHCAWVSLTVGSWQHPGNTINRSWVKLLCGQVARWTKPFTQKNKSDIANLQHLLYYNSIL